MGEIICTGITILSLVFLILLVIHGEKHNI
jgi:hypothetical protein